MKKVLFFIALALGLSATVANAQNDTRTAAATTAQRGGIGIRFADKECSRFGFECIRIEILTRQTQDALIGVASKDAQGKPVLTVDAKQNPTLVRQLMAKGKLELTENVTLSPEVSERLTGKRTPLLIKKGVYPVTNPRTNGEIIIICGPVTIIFIW